MEVAGWRDELSPLGSREERGERGRQLNSNRSHPENTRHVGDLEPSSSVMMIKAAACLPDRPVCYPAYLAGGWLRSLSVGRLARASLAATCGSPGRSVNGLW